MDYYDVLNNCIKKSGLTLKQIEMKTEQLGDKISKSQISNIANGRKIPKPEKNIVLAKALGIEENELLYMAYLQHAPDELKNFVVGFKDTIAELIKIYLQSGFPDEECEEGIEFLKNSRPYALVKYGWDSLDKIIKEGTLYVEYAENEIKYAMPELAPSKIIDESMYPIIAKGDKLHFGNKKYVEVGDIVLVKILKKGTYKDYMFYRRYMINGDGRYIFKAEQKKFPSFRLNEGEFEILYKVARVTKNL